MIRTFQQPAPTGVPGVMAVDSIFLAAALTNLLSNLPATLMLVPLIAHSPGLVLAVLLAVNVGPEPVALWLTCGSRASPE